jgi:DinB superfamily
MPDPAAVPAVDRLREQLLAIVDGHGAHMPFDEAVADFPAEAINRLPPNVPYTPWALLEHVRIAQHDILAYITSRDYLEPSWPEEYWPARGATATPEQWAATIAGFRADQRALRDLVADPATDLLATIPGTPGHTILREVRLVGDHNAYHLGEFAILRQVMGTWPPGREE